ncbi:STAS domain-containing protein [Candidatus Electronema sp. TJ]|uniref:STAS domain-containing protein n=1 Tax=Candidatus Electronema sp. TJ TaxID=3401573 RepID=UPI003AA9CDA2
MNIINWLGNNMLAGRNAGCAGRGDIEMIIEITPQRDCTVVRSKTGRMDAVAAASFREAMFRNKAVRRDCPVILDLHGVNYIDDNGLGAILSVMQAMQEKTEMLLCGAGENLKKIFQLTRVDGVLKSYESFDEAEQEARRRIQRKREGAAAGVRNASMLQNILRRIGVSSTN